MSIFHCVFNEFILFIISGFVFSPDEPSALVQYEGGPCSVIAPVQAHIFKNIFKEYGDSWQKVK